MILTLLKNLVGTVVVDTLHLTLHPLSLSLALFHVPHPSTLSTPSPLFPCSHFINMFFKWSAHKQTLCRCDRGPITQATSWAGLGHMQPILFTQSQATFNQSGPYIQLWLTTDKHKRKFQCPYPV